MTIYRRSWSKMSCPREASTMGKTLLRCPTCPKLFKYELHNGRACQSGQAGKESPFRVLLESIGWLQWNLPTLIFAFSPGSSLRFLRAQGRFVVGIINSSAAQGGNTNHHPEGLPSSSPSCHPPRMPYLRFGSIPCQTVSVVT